MEGLTRERILKLGMTAPNVDNAQPFYFQWEGERLSIFRDEDRDRRRGNAGNYVSMVGLGCLVECILIAASGEGFSAEVNFQYDPRRLEAPWVVIAFSPGQAEPDELLPGLAIRCSDRQRYRGGDLSDPVFRRVVEDAVQFEGCKLYFQDPDDRELLDYLLRCNEILWLDKHILPEMLSWVRWNRGEVERTRDGVPWQSLGVNFITSRLMWLVARSERFRRFARRSGGLLQAQQKTLEEQVLSSAGLGCLTVREARPEAMFRVGRLFLRAWVRLNLSGYGVQVMAKQSLHVFQHIAGVLLKDYPAASKRVFAEGAKVLPRAFKLPEGEIPAWMFRTGVSTPLPAEMRTLRLPLSEVLRSASA